MGQGIACRMIIADLPWDALPVILVALAIALIPIAGDRW